MERLAPILALLLAFSLLQIGTVSSQEGDFLLIGYGGEKFLPFLDGAKYRFVVGERLVITALGSDVPILLTTSSGETHAFYVKAGADLEVWKFRPQDEGVMTLSVVGGGSASIEVVGVEESALGWIELHPKYETDPNNAEKLLEARILGSTLSGFAATGTDTRAQRLLARPNSTLNLTVPSDVITVSATLKDYTPIELTGFSDKLYIVYRAEPVIAQYKFEASNLSRSAGVISIKIPPLGEVGTQGLMPTRYGTFILELYYVSRSGQRHQQAYDVMIAPIFEAPPSMSSVATVSLEQLIQEGLEVLTANMSVGRFENIKIKVPVFSVKVYDRHLQEWVEDYSISFTGYNTIRNGSESLIIPLTVPITRAPHQETISLEPMLTVYSVRMGDSVGPVTLEVGKPVIIFVDGREVEVEVRFAAGYLVDKADVYVNGSLRGVSGRLSLRLPKAVYNFTAETPYGKGSTVADVGQDEIVVIKIRAYTVETIALITVFLVQLSVLGTYLWRWYRTVRRGDWRGRYRPAG
ncbi:MAG: hypothetical protein QXY54_06655 [Nitrososphaerota archaeon]